MLTPDIASSVFEKLPDNLQAYLLVKLDKKEARLILKKMSADKVTDLFDHLSDEPLKKYLNLLQKDHRKNVISLLHFDPKSAGGIMNSEVLTLPKNINIKNSISLLQRLKPQKKHLQQIYVTDPENKLVGYINVDELLLNKPDTTIGNILHKPVLVIDVNEDQEEVAQQMRHYSLLSAPVVDKQHHFLGLISADEIFNIFQEEASEDVYKISGLSPTEYPYFQTPFWKLIWQRSAWLAPLLLFQSVSSFVLSRYQFLLANFTILIFFINMLIGTGGNAGNQSGALVIRGLATGEINRKNSLKLFFREFKASIIISIILALISFVRVCYTPGSTIPAAIAISISLSLIVIVSMSIGTLLPIIFERLNIDPAHSAAPFLATLMDIIGIIIYCTVSAKILG
jgi:magnesium transporter